jgi:hypothetical protein
MKILKVFSSAMFCAAGLAALGAKANAAVIPVADPYFDEFPAGFSAANYFQVACGTGCAFADKPVVGWTSSATRSQGANSGQWQIGQTTNRFNGDPMINATTPEPIVVRSQNASVSQVVSNTTAVAGVTYTLDVAVGFAKDAVDKGFVELIVGNDKPVFATPLASLNLTQNQMQETGNWYDFEASYTATAADAGDPIEIFLSSINNGQGFAYWGNVRLTDSLSVSNPVATPEPATWAMILIGFGGMAGVAAVRRSLRQRSAGGQLA